MRHAGEAAIDLGDDVDDGAAALRDHRGAGHGLRHREGADEVVADDLLEVLQAHVGGEERALTAGVIDQDVDASNCLHGFDEGGNLRRLPDVAPGLRQAVAARRDSSCRMAAMGSGRRPQMASRAPQSASSRTIAAPMPVPPPVTIATPDSRIRRNGEACQGPISSAAG